MKYGEINVSRKFHVIRYLLATKLYMDLPPAYLSELIAHRTESRYSLRSSSKFLLQPPRTKTLRTPGDRSFTAAANLMLDFGLVDLCFLLHSSHIKSSRGLNKGSTRLCNHLSRLIRTTIYVLIPSYS